METTTQYSNDTKEVFKNCGTCSQTFAHLLNREFGFPKELEEMAIDPLAGGIGNQGHQCGMLWGATLAVGAEAYRREDDLEKATAAAIIATQHIVESFVNRTQTVNCKEIIGVDLSNMFGLLKYMIKVLSKGMDNSQCFNLAEKWAPEAVEAAVAGLTEEQIHINHKPLSCASLVVREMGGSEQEQAMVAGFAGGMGLSGNGCGALGAAIWMKTLQWCRDHPGKNPPMLNNKIPKRLLKTLKEETGGEMLCHKITGQHFSTLDEHTEFLSCRGCEKLIKLLSVSN